MLHSLDAPAVRTWCRLALRALGGAREEIDAINVYPVADGDTGTNLFLTMESASQSVDAVFDGFAASGEHLGPVPVLRSLAHGALIGARGNSGTILAQLLRGMTDILVEGRPSSGSAHGEPSRESGGRAGAAAGEADTADVRQGELLGRALRHAAAAAYLAVAHPVEGTMLTVAAAAADAAMAAAEDAAGLAAVARAAYEGAERALAATPGQLAVLGRAGVVDAGGRGLVVLLGALVDAFAGAAPMGPLATRPSPAPRPPNGDAVLSAVAPSPAVTATSAGGEGRPVAVTAPVVTESDHGAAERPTAGAPAALRVTVPHTGPGAPSPAWDPARGCGPDGDADPHVVPGGPGFEVIYLLEAADRAVDTLRRRLDRLGDSLVVVGGDGLWNVHVHVDDVGAAVEAGIEAGRPYRIRVTHFGDQARGAAPDGAGTGRARRPAAEPRTGRAVVAVVGGDGLAELYGRAGATVVALRPGDRPASGDLAAAIRDANAREVVLLPNDAELRQVAGVAAEQARADGVRVALIPTRSAVQGIAALAVHEPGRRFDEDVVAMTSAAGATRSAELAVAEHRSWTMAGVCQAGDVLGLIDGDVAVIGADLVETGVIVLDRMLAAGGEMVTLVLGDGAPPDLADRIEAHIREGHLAVDTVVYEGGQPGPLLLIGVE